MKMKDFDITMTHYNRGDIITGTIVVVGEKEVTVAIGGLREGVFPREELEPTFKLGDAILVMVTGEIDEKGCLVMTHAGVNKAIEDREKLKNLKGKKLWEVQMIARKRKTLALCHDCHVKLHKGILD